MSTDPTLSGGARFVGARTLRREDPRMLTGRGRYLDDVAVPGVAHVAFVRSPYAHAAITGLDTAAACARAGVVAVLTADDLDAVRDLAAVTNNGIIDVPMPPPLASGRVTYVGDPVAMVIAVDRATAEDAVTDVAVDYEPLPAQIGSYALADAEEVAIPAAVAARLASASPPDQRPDDVFARARHVVSETIGQHRYIPVPMEPRGVIAEWDPYTPCMTVWTTTQGAHRVREHVARALGLADNRVRVIVGDVGGGFGQKLSMSRDETAVVLAARAVGRPVQWIEDRWENLVAAPHSREERAEVSMAFDDDGGLLAIHVDHVCDVGADGSPNLGLARLVAGPYKVGHVSGTTRSIRTNTSGRGAYRGPWMFETVARETMIELAARELGIDPVELRRRNVVQQSDLPYASRMGVYEDVSPAETLDQVVAMLGYAEFRADQSAARADGRYLGVGFACFMEHTAHGAGLGATDAVTLRIDTSGAVALVTGVNSQGNSVETTMAQVVADHLGVDIGEIAFLNGDTASVPIGAPTGGSRNAVYGGGAARAAALELRDRVATVAAHHFEVDVADIEIERSRAFVRGTPARAVTFAELARIAYLQPSALPAEAPLGLDVTVRFHAGPGLTWSNATHCCTCEVDIETGVVKILRYLVSEDCGTMINPMIVEGQIAGGVVQGIGGALLERFVYDDDGNPLTTTFMDYLLPTTTDVPTIEFGHIETPSSRPGGFKGMGEGGAIGAPAAVQNAVADALAPLGVKITRQPLDPSSLRTLIRDAAGADASTAVP